MSENTRGQRRDAAEKWLHQNDPDYDTTKYQWQAHWTDALVKAFESELHPMFEYLRPLDPDRDDGNYIRCSSSRLLMDALWYA